MTVRDDEDLYYMINLRKLIYRFFIFPSVWSRNHFIQSKCLFFPERLKITIFFYCICCFDSLTEEEIKIIKLWFKLYCWQRKNSKFLRWISILVLNVHINISRSLVHTQLEEINQKGRCKLLRNQWKNLKIKWNKLIK